MITWIAIKEFSKKAWKFIVDQWLFFLTAAVGIFAFVMGSRKDKSGEVLELRKQAENEEREIRKEAQERTEEVVSLNDSIATSMKGKGSSRQTTER